MKQMLKIELERAFRSSGFWLSLMIGMLISIIQYIQKVIPAVSEILLPMKDKLAIPVCVHQTWIAMGDGWYYTLFVRLIPLLAVIPYAVTYYTDNKKGIVHNYYSRTNKIKYLLAKWMAVFITGGMTAIIPLMVNLMATSAVLPSFIALDYIISCNANGMWSYILYSHPYIYYILSFILQFICAGLIATVSLLISRYVNNAFIVLLFPSVLCEFMNATAGWLPARKLKALAPWRLFRIDQLAVKYWQTYVIFICTILVMDLVVYVWRGVKDDVL